MADIQKPERMSIEQASSLAVETRDFISKSRSQNTVRSYRSGWKDWASFSEAQGSRPLPADPQVLLAYFTILGKTKSMSTIDQRRASIRYVHKIEAEHDPFAGPVITELIEGIRRVRASDKVRKVEPIKVDRLDLICSHIGKKENRDLRDRALLLVGFQGFFRRSEIVQLTASDVEFNERGALIHLRKSKTDQMQEGQYIGIPYSVEMVRLCPVVALKNWMNRVGCVGDDPIFVGTYKNGDLSNKAISPKQVARIIKRRCQIAGLKYEDFSGHSMRRGGATSAAENGSTEAEIMRSGRWKSSKSARGYVQHASAFDGIAKTGL